MTGSVMLMFPFNDTYTLGLGVYDFVFDDVLFVHSSESREEVTTTSSFGSGFMIGVRFGDCWSSLRRKLRKNRVGAAGVSRLSVTASPPDQRSK